VRLDISWKDELIGADCCINKKASCSSAPKPVAAEAGRGDITGG